jgi:proteasome lid subunit RPN8/RPN11
VREASQTRYRYLGSWHTHPLGRPQPSRTDIAAVEAIIDEPEVRLPRPLIIIVRVWPLRRTLCDRNTRAFRWSTVLGRLVAEDLISLREVERQHETLELDWDRIVE